VYERISFILLIMLFHTFGLLAQTVNISGTVKDVYGAPLPGVSIVIKGQRPVLQPILKGNFQSRQN